MTVKEELPVCRRFTRWMGNAVKFCAVVLFVKEKVNLIHFTHLENSVRLREQLSFLRSRRQQVAVKPGEYMQGQSLNLPPSFHPSRHVSAAAFLT